MDAEQARAALAGVREAESGLAATMVLPGWYHLAFGAVMAGIVLSTALDQPLAASCFVGSMLGVVALGRYNRKRFGIFVNGWRAGRTRMVASVLALGLWGLIGWIMTSRHGANRDTVALVAGAVAFVGSGIASVVWMRVWRAELASDRP